MTTFQRTVKKSLSFKGVGVHSGRVVSVHIRPAPVNTGIIFQRIDIANKPYIKAHPSLVFDTRLATRIGCESVYVSTIEHLMAALFGFGIDNAIIEMDQSEVPILDGSAVPFLVLLDEAGVVDLQEPRKILVIKKTVEVVDDKIPTRFMRVEPAKQPLISYAINFEDTSAIGYQSVSLPYTAKVFCEELSFARTFCLKEEIDHMHARGLAQGGSLENAIVVSKNYGILNTQGLRHAQEFVKHKILDCIGDLYLLGMPLLGHVVANRAGHDLHIKLAKAILDQVNSYSVVSLSPKEALRFETLFTFPKSLAELQLNFKFLARG